jgi:hypothetical protein
MFYKHNPSSQLTQARLDDMQRHIKYNETFDYQLCWEESQIVEMLVSMGRVQKVPRTVRAAGKDVHTFKYFVDRKALAA